MLQSTLDATKAVLGDLRAWVTGGNDYSIQEVRELYARSQTIYICANIRARNVSAVRMRAVDSAGKPIQHDVNAVFQSFWNYTNVMYRSELTMFFQGSNLILPQATAFGTFQPSGDNLRWLNPRSWSKDADPWTGLRGFNVGGEFVDKDDAIYMYGFDFNDDFEGISPAEVAFYAAGGQAELWQTVYAFMMNRAIPAAIIQPASDSNAMKNKDAPGKLRELLTEMFQGSRNQGKTMVSPERLEALILQLDIEKAGISTLSPEQRQAIAEAAEVPLLLIDFSGATYANGDAAVQFWYRQWLKPRCEWYAGNFSQFFSHWYQEQITIAPDFTTIIQEDDDTERINSQLAAGYRDLYSAQVDTGIEADERLRGVYIWNGTPTKIETLTEPPMAAPAPVAPGIQSPGIPPVMTLAGHIPDPIYNEIAIAARKGAAFVAVDLPEHTEVYIKSLHGIGIEKPEIVRAAKAFYLSVRAAKAIQATRLDFEYDFETLMDSARTDAIRRKNFGRELMGLIETYTERGFKDGLIDGGILDAALDDEDMDALNAVILDQRTYVRGFTDKLYGDGIDDELASQKSAMWWNGSIMPSYFKGLNSAAKNSYYLWVIDLAKENCRSCKALDGQIHRLRDYTKANYLPNSDRLECGAGKQCGCKLQPMPGAKSTGRFPVSAMKSHEHSEITS